MIRPTCNKGWLDQNVRTKDKIKRRNATQPARSSGEVVMKTNRV